jgi:hypothetical protein
MTHRLSNFFRYIDSTALHPSEGVPRVFVDHITSIHIVKQEKNMTEFASAISSGYRYNEQMWVVSILNTGARLGGHSVLVVEGIRGNDVFLGSYDILARALPDQNGAGLFSSFENINRKGYISQVRVFENTKPVVVAHTEKTTEGVVLVTAGVPPIFASLTTHETPVQNMGRFDYSQYPAQSYYIPAAKAEEMIVAIKLDKSVCEKADAGQGPGNGPDKTEYPPYQMLGKDSMFTNPENGDNCAGWCLKKLAIAGIGDGTGKPMPAKATGQCTIL